MGCSPTSASHGNEPAGGHAPTHQIVRSIQPGEDWLWCYTDQTLVQARPSLPAIDRHPRPI